MGSNGIGDLNNFDFVSGGMYPGSQIDHSAYADPTQLPLAAQAVRADYDPETNPLTGEATSRFAKGGDVESNVDASFGYPNSVYMDPAYGYAHDPAYNAAMQSRSEGVLNRYQSGNRGELSPEEEEIVKIRAMIAAGNQKYDPRYMPLRPDDRPLNTIQAAMMRLQADKQIGEGNARAGISALAAALPNRQGVTAIPGAYDVGYNTPVGPGNLDISAYRAMKAMPTGSTPTGAMARYSIPFNEGGIAALHFDGTEGSQVEDTAPTEPAPPPTMSELADQLKLAYRTGTNYDDLWKQFAATKEQDPTQWYKHQLDFLGQQQGWQIGQNRSDRLAAFQPQIDSTIQQAKDAGVSDKEIKSILGNSSQEGRNANVQRIATLSETGGSGFNFQKDLQPGLVALALATAAAATAQPELLGLGEAAVPLADITGSTFAGPAFALPEGAAATTAGGITALGADAGGATIGTAGGDAVVGGSTASQLPSLSYTVPEIGGSYVAPGTVGAMNAALPAGATLGTEGTALGATIGGGTGAMSAAIPAGTVIGTGEAGTTLGATYLAGANGLPATTALGTPILASSVGTLGSEATAGGLTTKQLMAANMGMNALKSGFGGTSGQGGTAGGQSTPAMQMPNQPYIAPTMLATPNYGKLYDAQIYNYNTRRAAQGGMMYGNGGGISSLGSYSDGGRLLKGPGDGMSDDIPAHIGEKQPAALADGEFVIPADVVSHLGNGSTDAGAKQLYKMMDRIREARTGQKRQGRQINPNKFLPKG
jgi:hypothetical protein